MAGGTTLLHTMIRVFDLEKSLDFYCRHMGMTLHRKSDYPEGRFTLAFLGYGTETNRNLIELTYNWDRTEPYVIGDAFGHIAVAVDDIYTFCTALEEHGVAVPRQPGPMKHGTTILAFVRDPDGYMIELVER